MKKLLCITALLSIFMTGCEKKEEMADTDEKIIITHAQGETRVVKNPKSVVVLDFSALDTMNRLGITDCVVAIPKNSLPQYLSQFADDRYENIGGLKEFDYEKINALAPDLIIISGRQIGDYEELGKIAPTINLNIDSSRYIESYKENTKIIGEIWNMNDQAEKLIEEVENDIADINAIASQSNAKALIILHNAGKFSAYGSGSRFGIIHDSFGVKAADSGIEVSTHGQSITSEYIAKINPDILFIVDRNVVVTRKPTVKTDIENKLIQKTNAYKNNKIVYLPPDYWYLANGGTQSIELMIDDVKKAVK